MVLLEILLVLLEGPDHPMDRVSAEQWSVCERSLKFTNGIRALALTLMGQAEQVVGTS